MSLYREAGSGRRRLWIALVGVLLLVAAVAVGLVLATGGEPSKAEQLESLQEDVQPALAALELVPIHYESTNPTTHAAAADQLAVARATVEEQEDELRALDPAATDELLAELRELEALVATTGRTPAVEAATGAAADDLRHIVRLD